MLHCVRNTPLARLPSSVGSRRQLPPREALVVGFIFAMSILLLLGIAKTQLVIPKEVFKPGLPLGEAGGVSRLMRVAA